MVQAFIYMDLRIYTARSIILSKDCEASIDLQSISIYSTLDLHVASIIFLLAFSSFFAFLLFLLSVFSHCVFYSSFCCLLVAVFLSGEGDDTPV